MCTCQQNHHTIHNHQLLAWTVSGKLRWYAASMGMGAALILALLLLG
jgi:NADH-quinone oxidoreductase subunit L